eukprot:9696674-Ditylum_brightwellii.AAC.1
MNQSFNVKDDNQLDDEGSMDDIESISIAIDTMESFTIKTFSLMSIDTDRSDENSIISVVYESLSTRILCAVDTLNKCGGESGYVAIKMLTDQFPGIESISRLENEYIISKHLSDCKYVRKVLNFIKNEGQYALYLEWAPGVTLKEWIRSSLKRMRSVDTCNHDCEYKDSIALKCFDIEKNLCLAKNVVAAFSEMHECGVVHNNITADNILVDVAQSNGNLSLKIIDLGRASLLTGHCGEVEKIQGDICSIGSIFFELFTGMCPYD